MACLISKNKFWLVMISLCLTVSLLASNAFAWNDGRYHHPRGYHLYKGHWWLGDTLLAGLVAGAIITTLPPRCRTVYVGGNPYYYDGTYYYQSGPSGYVVVQPALRPAPPLREEVITVAPYPRAVWVPGHWHWNRRFGEYVWVPGHWRRY